MEFYEQHEWARDPRFNSFWEHYRCVDKWVERHRAMASAALQSITVGEEPPRCLKRGRIRGGRRVQAKKERRTASLEMDYVKNAASEAVHIGSENMPCSSSSFHHEDDITDEGNHEDMEEDGEMTEEMRAFFEKTIEHRRKRDAEREAKRASEIKARSDHWIVIENEEYVLADKIGVEGVQRRTLDAPDEGQREKERRETAREMYGEGAQKILAMETALDLQFDSVYRKKQPALWPNIPLKF